MATPVFLLTQPKINNFKQDFDEKEKMMIQVNLTPSTNAPRHGTIKEGDC